MKNYDLVTHISLMRQPHQKVFHYLLTPQPSYIFLHETVDQTQSLQKTIATRHNTNDTRLLSHMITMISEQISCFPRKIDHCICAGKKCIITKIMAQTVMMPIFVIDHPLIKCPS